MKPRYSQFNKNEFETHRLVFNLIDEGTRVLDVGCATGYFAKALLKKQCETWGIDVDKSAVKKASKYCKKAIIHDLNNKGDLPFPKNYFDHVIILDVIEHLLHPENILSIVKLHLKKGGTIIVSTPNIAHASIRLMIMKGKFQYTSSGIMDNTHLHFYTKSSFSSLLVREGYKIEKIIPTNGMCKVPFLYKITDRLPFSMQYKIAKILPTLFSYQFIAIATQNKKKAIIKK